MNFFVDILEYKEIDEDCIDSFMLSEIKMKKDFGNLEKDETHYQIVFDFTNGSCKTFNEDGEETNNFQFKLTAV